MSLTYDQTRSIIITERVGSILSLCGAAFVIVTFLWDSNFRKPINRLVFYATFGNILTNVATLVSTAGIEAGLGSPLCQFQGFLIQWFMPADALWTFAMACNVYLTFFRSYDTSQLRRLEPKYLLGCYGIPFVAAFVFLFLRTASRGKVYGSAMLWCWVSLKWDFLRVALFYGPVWLVIIATFAIYLKVGGVVFKWRKQLLTLEREVAAAKTASEPGPSQILKTLEVTITSSGQGTTNKQDLGPQGEYKGWLNDPEKYDSRPDSTKTQSPHRLHPGGFDPNKAALKYGKCAVLFFIALLITWVPSSINRVYTLFRPDAVVFGLNYAASLVLPLQGAWNAIVYATTSSYAVRSLFRNLTGTWRHKNTSNVSFHLRSRRQPLGSLDSDKDSMGRSARTQYLQAVGSDRTLVEQTK